MPKLRLVTSIALTSAAGDRPLCSMLKFGTPGEALKCNAGTEFVLRDALGLRPHHGAPTTRPD